MYASSYLSVLRVGQLVLMVVVLSGLAQVVSNVSPRAISKSQCRMIQAYPTRVMGKKHCDQRRKGDALRFC